MSPPPSLAGAAAPPAVDVASATPLIARAAIAAVLTPILGYWVPMHVFEWLIEGMGILGGLAVLFTLIPAMMGGAYIAIVAAMRVGRPVGTKPFVPAIEELLVALLGLIAPNLPSWFGVRPAEGVGQPLTIQAIVVLLGLLVCGGLLGGLSWVPAIQVGSIRPGRELTARAMVAALMPTALLSALLPVVFVGSDIEALVGGDTSSLEHRILVAWGLATLIGIAVGMGAWRDGRPPFLEKPEQLVIAAVGMGLAVAAWMLGGGLNAHPAVFLFQPAIIFVATVVMSTRRDRHEDRIFGRAAPTGRHDGLLIPPGGGIPLGTRETAHVDPATGARETRVEARWLVPRAMVTVADEYRGHDGLTVKSETDTLVVLARTAPSAAAVRVAALPMTPPSVDSPAPRPRTEVTVRTVRRS